MHNHYDRTINIPIQQIFNGTTRITSNLQENSASQDENFVRHPGAYRPSSVSGRYWDDQDPREYYGNAGIRGSTVLVDYSDEEEERAARRKPKKRNKRSNQDSDEVQVIHTPKKPSLTSFRQNFHTKRPQNVAAPQQNMQPQYPASAVSSGYFPPQLQQLKIQSSPNPQLMVQPTALNFMNQPQMSPHPGMAPKQVDRCQVPYFNNFPNQPSNFAGQPVNFPGQPGNFAGQPINFPGQPGNFLSQSANFPFQPANFLGQPGNVSNQSGSFSSQAPHFRNRAMNLVNTPPTLQQNSWLGQPPYLYQ